jgi:hypothetical protein
MSLYRLTKVLYMYLVLIFKLGGVYEALQAMASLSLRSLQSCILAPFQF